MATLIELPGKLESNREGELQFQLQQDIHFSYFYYFFFAFCDLLLATFDLLAICELRVASGK